MYKLCSFSCNHVTYFINSICLNFSQPKKKKNHTKFFFFFLKDPLFFFLDHNSLEIFNNFRIKSILHAIGKKFWFDDKELSSRANAIG